MQQHLPGVQHKSQLFRPRAQLRELLGLTPSVMLGWGALRAHLGPQRLVPPVNVDQRQHRKQAVGVLGQAPVAHLGKDGFAQIVALQQMAKVQECGGQRTRGSAVARFGVVGLDQFYERGPGHQALHTGKKGRFAGGLAKGLKARCGQCGLLYRLHCVALKIN